MVPLGEAGGHHSVTALDKHLKLNMIAFDWAEKRDLPVQPAFHIASQPSVILFRVIRFKWFIKHRRGNGDPRGPFSRFEGLRSISKTLSGSFALLEY
jgi:hypothetical protein